MVDEIDHFDSLNYYATFLSSGDPGAIETAKKAAALLQRGRTPDYSVKNWAEELESSLILVT